MGALNVKLFLREPLASALTLLTPREGVRIQMSEVRDRGAGDGDQRSDASSQMSGVRGRWSVVGMLTAWQVKAKVQVEMVIGTFSWP